MCLVQLVHCNVFPRNTGNIQAFIEDELQYLDNNWAFVLANINYLLAYRL